MESKFNRREFIGLVGVGSAGLSFSPLLLSSCESNDPSVPFGVWKEMIAALEQSPDHLLGRKKALVAAKDPKAMVEFVRDSLQMIPEIGQFLHQANRMSMYGTEVALRCGLATPREKAEILKNMLTEAGFEARVVLEATEITEEDVKNNLKNGKNYWVPTTAVGVPMKYPNWMKNVPVWQIILSPNLPIKMFLP